VLKAPCLRPGALASRLIPARDELQRGITVTNGVLLAGRLILAASLLPEAVARATNVSGFGLQLWMKGMPYPTAVASGVVVAELVGPLLWCSALRHGSPPLP
jgi:hypothetical protein